MMGRPFSQQGVVPSLIADTFVAAAPAPSIPMPTSPSLPLTSAFRLKLKPIALAVLLCSMLRPAELEPLLLLLFVLFEVCEIAPGLSGPVVVTPPVVVADEPPDGLSDASLPPESGDGALPLTMPMLLADMPLEMAAAAAADCATPLSNCKLEVK